MIEWRFGLTTRRFDLKPGDFVWICLMDPCGLFSNKMMMMMMMIYHDLISDLNKSKISLTYLVPYAGQCIMTRF